MNTTPAFLGVDWGTSNLRVYLVSQGGQVIEQTQSAKGILHCSQGTFGDTLTQLAGSWLTKWPQLSVYMAGMIGSKQGWRETSYLPCPIHIDDIASQLVPLSFDGTRKCWIVPGLSCTTPDGTPDVMRGEETQLIGAIHRQRTGSQLYCLPGTHAKWVHVKDGVIQHFATYMTGELFDILQHHGLLSVWMQDVPQEDKKEWFLKGVELANKQTGLLHHLFGVRSLSLEGTLPPKHQRSYLSGLLIGHELRAPLQHIPQDTPVTLIGATSLTKQYERACSHLQRLLHVLSGERMVLDGLTQLHASAARKV